MVETRNRQFRRYGRWRPRKNALQLVNASGGAVRILTCSRPLAHRQCLPGQLEGDAAVVDLRAIAGCSWPTPAPAPSRSASGRRPPLHAGAAGHLEDDAAAVDVRVQQLAGRHNCPCIGKRGFSHVDQRERAWRRIP